MKFHRVRCQDVDVNFQIQDIVSTRFLAVFSRCQINWQSMKSKYLRLQSKHTKRCIDAFTVSRGWYCCCVVSHNDNHSCIDMVIFNIPTVGKRDSSRSKIRWNKSFIVYSKRLLANITRVHQLRCSASARSAAKRFQRLF